MEDLTPEPAAGDRGRKGDVGMGDHLVLQAHAGSESHREAGPVDQDAIGAREPDGRALVVHGDRSRRNVGGWVPARLIPDDLQARPAWFGGPEEAITVVETLYFEAVCANSGWGLTSRTRVG